MENLDQSAEHDNETAAEVADAPAVDVTDELSKLKARADMMNIEYHPKIGVDKLRQKINDHLDGKAPVVEKAPEVVVAKGTPAVETEGQRRQRLMDEASKLVRVIVSCKNPAKKEWPGQLFTSGNRFVGTFSKFVPFDNEEGWHIPNILFQQIKDAQFQSFYTEKSKNGVDIRKGKLIKEFAVEVLEPLTPAEMHELAQRQAMGKTIDN